MNRLEALKIKLKAATITAPPYPWQQVTILPVGGLRAVGYDRHSDLLLIVSSQGRGVVDCLSGQKVARDYEEYHGDEKHLEAEGIGPLAGKTIYMTGLHGGGLPLQTEDTWRLEIVTLDWPVNDIFLFAPSSWIYGSFVAKPDHSVKLASEAELRACGFSHTGCSFVIATASDLTIYRRNQE